MNSMTTRHQIEFGESLRWEPPAGTAEFYVWGKRTADNSIMRWRRVAGWEQRSHRHESHGAGIVGQHRDTERSDRDDLERPADRVRRL